VGVTTAAPTKPAVILALVAPVLSSASHNYFSF
jgi:hypothetical protein